MIEIPFLFAELAFALVWLLARVAVWIKRRKINKRQEAKLLLMFINLAVILRLAFFPFFRQNGQVLPLVFDPSHVFPLNVNLIPFSNFFYYKTTGDILLNLIGNVLMFAPTGIILPIAYKRIDSFGKTVLAGACISLCIELLQLPFSVRTSDINDVILNTAGVALGYGIYYLFKTLKRKIADKKTRTKNAVD